MAGENEAPARVLDRWNRVVSYAPDAEGHVVVQERDGYEPAAWVYERACGVIRQEMADARALVAAGKRSPLWYHMVCMHLDLKTVAAYVRMWRIRVWWHLRPRPFARLRQAVLERYARALNLPVDRLRTLPERDPEPQMAQHALPAPDDDEEG